MAFLIPRVIDCERNEGSNSEKGCLDDEKRWKDHVDSGSLIGIEFFRFLKKAFLTKGLKMSVSK